MTGQPYTDLAEGYFTVKALLDLEARTGVELPISRAVYQVLYENVPARDTIDGLFRRTQKMEF